MKNKKLLSAILALLNTFSCSTGAVRFHSQPGTKSRWNNNLSFLGNKNARTEKRLPTGGKFLRGVSGSREKAIMKKLESAGVSKERSETNIKKVVTILMSGFGIAFFVAFVLAIKYCDGSSLSWEADKEKIIKFVSWNMLEIGMGRSIGSCLEDSYLNMFLNPVLVEEILNIPTQNWDQEGLKKQAEKAWGEEEKVLESKIKLIEAKDKILKLWDICKNHNYISEKDKMYNWQNLWSDFSRGFPEAFGNPTSVKESGKSPSLISGSLSTLQKCCVGLGKFRINDVEYFVGGMVLSFCNEEGNGSHTVYVHLLYDDKDNIKRFIIQNPRGENNSDKSKYATQKMGTNEILTNLLRYVKIKRLKVDSVLMIKKDKFEASGYWKDKSLPFELEECSCF